MLPMGYNLDIIIDNMREDLIENIRLMTTDETRTNSPPPPLPARPQKSDNNRPTDTYV